MPTTDLQRGVTLIELLLAVAISAILLAALNGLIKLGLDTQASVRAGNELAYQGRFALERLADKARIANLARIPDLAPDTPPKVLTTPDANTTGDWFAPAGCSGAACVMYCRNACNQLIETTTTGTGCTSRTVITTTDTVCTGSTVIANHVSAFAATLPAAMGPVDRQIGVFRLTLSKDSNTLYLSSSIRFGGGTQ